MPGATCSARWIITVSAIEEVTTSPGPNESCAQRMISRALACSSSEFAWIARSDRSSVVLMKPPSRRVDLRPGRGTSQRTPGGSCGIPNRRLRAGRASPPRSTGSSRWPAGWSDLGLWTGHSYQHGFVGSGHPLGEPLTLAALGDERASQPLHVVRQLIGGHLVATQLASEAGVESEPAAEVDLEALDLAPVGARHQLSLEPDVGHLDPGTGVGAAVEVDGDGGLQRAEARLQLIDQGRRPGLGLHDRELAELDPRAGQNGPTPGVRPGREPDLLSGC